MSHSNNEYTVEDFYFFKIRPLWQHFWREHPAFWFICGYLFFEYWRPQSIYPAIDIIPWTKTCLLAALCFSFFDKKSKLSWTSTHFWLLLFTLQIHLSFLFAYDVSWSERYHIDFFQWVIIFIAITSIVTTKERFYIFFMVFFLSSLKIAVGTSRTFAMRGFSFTPWGLQGPPGFFENSGELAILMVMIFALSLYLTKSFWSTSGKIEKIVLLCAVICSALTITGSSSRGSQLALAAVLVWFYNYKLLNPKILIIVVSLALSLVYILPDEQKTRFSTMGGDGTSQTRLLYWTNGMDMLKKHPFTGVGYYNFIPYYSVHYPDDILFQRNGEFLVELPHNILIQVGTDAGIPALVFYLLLIFSLFRNTKKVKGVSKQINNGLLLGVVGFFVAGQFVTVGYYPFLWISAAMITSLKDSEVSAENMKNEISNSQLEKFHSTENQQTR